VGGGLTGNHEGCLDAEIGNPVGKSEGMTHFRSLLNPIEFYGARKSASSGPGVNRSSQAITFTLAQRSTQCNIRGARPSVQHKLSKSPVIEQRFV
jgi:hypothetical protein